MSLTKLFIHVEDNEDNLLVPRTDDGYTVASCRLLATVLISVRDSLRAPTCMSNDS